MLRLVFKYVYLAFQLFKWGIFEFFTNGRSDSVACLVGKTAIVTGGNSGIGFAISTLLASRGCRVIIADVVDSEVSVRRIVERTRNQNVLYKRLDLSSFRSIREFVREIKNEEDKIDILVNNAGTGELKCTEDGLSNMMQVNIFGPFLLTHLLIDSLKAAQGARVIFTGSAMAFFAKLNLDNIDQRLNPVGNKFGVFAGIGMYQDSKLLNILVAREMAKRLRQQNIMVNSTDPGFVRTMLLYTPNKHITGIAGVIMRNFNILYIISLLFGQIPFYGAQTSFHLVSSEKIKETGKHYHRCRLFDTPEILQDQKFCNEVWNRIEEFVKLGPEEKL